MYLPFMMLLGIFAWIVFLMYVAFKHQKDMKEEDAEKMGIGLEDDEGDKIPWGKSKFTPEEIEEMKKATGCHVVWDDDMQCWKVIRLPDAIIEEKESEGGDT